TGWPLTQSCSVPICSTVLFAIPSIPTQIDESPFPLSHFSVGVVQSPATSLTAPACGSRNVPPKLAQPAPFWLPRAFSSSIGCELGISPPPSAETVPARQPATAIVAAPTRATRDSIDLRSITTTPSSPVGLAPEGPLRRDPRWLSI